MRSTAGELHRPRSSFLLRGLTRFGRMTHAMWHTPRERTRSWRTGASFEGHGVPLSSIYAVGGAVRTLQRERRQHAPPSRYEGDRLARLARVTVRTAGRRASRFGGVASIPTYSDATSTSCVPLVSPRLSSSLPPADRGHGLVWGVQSVAKKRLESALRVLVGNAVRARDCSAVATLCCNAARTPSCALTAWRSARRA